MTDETLQRVISSAMAAGGVLRGPPKAALVNSIRQLNDEEKHELHALFWVGRGDFDDFLEAVAHSRRTMRGEAIPTYLASQTRLAELLAAGRARAK
jgi:hypothetical protein